MLGMGFPQLLLREEIGQLSGDHPLAVDLFVAILPIRVLYPQRYADVRVRFAAIMDRATSERCADMLCGHDWLAGRKCRPQGAHPAPESRARDPFAFRGKVRYYGIFRFISFFVMYFSVQYMFGHNVRIS
jgi:hypothetical protein